MSKKRYSLSTMTTSLHSSNSSNSSATVPSISTKTQKYSSRNSHNTKKSKKDKPKKPTTRPGMRIWLKERTIDHAQIRESIISNAFNQTLEHIKHDLKYKIPCEIQKYKPSFIDYILLLFHSFVDPWNGPVAKGPNWFDKTHAWKITGLLVTYHVYNILLSNAFTPRHFMYYCNKIEGITDTHKKYIFHYCCVYFINVLKKKTVRFENTKAWPFIPSTATVKYIKLHQIWSIISENKVKVQSEKTFKDKNKKKLKNEKKIKYSPIIVEKHDKEWKQLLDEFRSILDTLKTSQNHTIVHRSLVNNIRNNSYNHLAPPVLSNEDIKIISAYGTYGYKLIENKDDVKENNNKLRKRKRNGTNRNKIRISKLDMDSSEGSESESDNINNIKKPPKKRLRLTKKVSKKFIKRSIKCKQSIGYNDETTCSEDENTMSESDDNSYGRKITRNMKKKKRVIDTSSSDEDNTNNITKPTQVTLRENDSSNKISNNNDNIQFNLPPFNFQPTNMNLNNNNSSINDLYSALHTFFQDANIANKSKDQIVNTCKNILREYKPIQTTITPQFNPLFPLSNNNINISSNLSTTTNSSVPTDITTNSSMISSEEMDMFGRNSLAIDMLNNSPLPLNSTFNMNNDVGSVAGFNYNGDPFNSHNNQTPYYQL